MDEQPSRADSDVDIPVPDETNPASYPLSNEDSVSPAADSGSSRELEKLLRRTPFLDLHERAGDIDRHPIRGRVCFCFDFALRLIVAVALLSVIGAVAWKTSAPLPAFWQGKP